MNPTAFSVFSVDEGCMTPAYMEMLFYVADVHLENPRLPNKSFEKSVGLNTMAFQWRLKTSSLFLSSQVDSALKL